MIQPKVLPLEYILSFICQQQFNPKFSCENILGSKKLNFSGSIKNRLFMSFAMLRAEPGRKSSVRYRVTLGYGGLLRHKWT